ncbi:hypothetical protein NBRC10512_004345 [Rhodotorula toruloides]|uniref:RHTO0S17e00386g1_1 n=2 Tax=Rhodotorula toruloides TaxID=5286 RepID=A0A061BMH2_RHOTO|nr:uncharacterized protein RHTO_03314 [Rhodotorula toruloides NP11]EMS20395.1 hypothetical protein RHTO_03314 [Rhodotorula toruloides NP11]CDR48285.1 RHTO0S17e00386g1_1 [Rhodotorula toruloides]
MVPPLPRSLLAGIVQCFDPLDMHGFRDLRTLTTVSKAFKAVAQPHLLSVVPVHNPQDSGIGRLLTLLRLLQTPSGEDEPTTATASKKGGKAGVKGKKAGAKAKGAKGGPKVAAKSVEWVDSEPEDHFIHEEGEGPAGKALDPRTKRLLAVLAKAPALAAYPTQLNFYGVFEGGATPRAVHRVLALCPNIQSIKLVQHASGDSDDERGRWPLLVLQTIAAERPRLHSLIIRGARIANSEAVLHALSGMTALKELEVEFANDDYLHEWDRSWNRHNFDFELERLVLSTPATTELFGDLTRTSRSTLRTVGIALLRDEYDLSGFTKLERVIITACQYGVVVATLPSLPKSVTYLEIRESTSIGWLDGRMRKYESEDEWSDELDADEVEELDEWERDEYEERWEERRADRDQKEIDNWFSSMLSSIPRHIKHLRLPQFLDDDEFKEVLGWLAAPSFLPNLRIFEVTDPLKDRNLDEEDLEEGEMDKMRMQRKKLADICAKRGVLLGPWDEDLEQVWNDEGRSRGLSSWTLGRRTLVAYLHLSLLV